MKKTPDEIAAEIATLKEMKPTVLRRSRLGDDHHDAIDGQIEALENTWDQSDIDDAVAGDVSEEATDLFSADNVREAAERAVEWMEGSEPNAPSVEWQELVRK